YHQYVSTSPDSPFSGKLVVMRLDEGVSRRLVGDQLTIEYADGRTTKRTVAADEIGTVLKDLDVVLSAEELDRLRIVLAAR
ncbi:MAG: N-hydroxyarylamine O-acetyltransferase, partial [Kribbellaceae bacterium]|nr:N-hydroxyarylamine O-acetyltransferase [Kribbellaceae bacterium]